MCTALRNKLTALCNEGFPEFVTVIKGPNSLNALNIREKYPTALDLTRATLGDLKQLRSGHKPSNDALALLIELARVSIGIRDRHRLLSLRLEQTQLIKELRLLQEHCYTLDRETTSIVSNAPHRHILTHLSVEATTASVEMCLRS